MRLSIILILLNKEITPFNFRFLIKNEIVEYEKNLSVLGGSSPILLIEDIPELKVTADDVRYLCYCNLYYR
jgi:hypothetical protein